MKHLITLGLFLLFTIKIFSQTDGISYQAVIIAPDALELPGVDSEGNYLPNANVSVKFIIFDSGNQIEFEEIQTTTTDEFGRINLIIGAVEHDNFEKISWNGTPKDLKVEIDFGNGIGYVDMSREILTFVPYAYHRNITATGTLDVDGDTFLNRELTVNGPTNLNSTLSVNDGNKTDLTGDLMVDGVTNLNNDLNVNNKSTTNLSGALNVGVATGLPDDDAPTVLNGNLTVIGESSFTGLTVDDLTVNNSTDITGSVAINSDTQITINSTLNGSDKDITKYPLKIEGGNQGLAIVIDGNRTNANNFVSFWDTTTTSGTTISGQTLTYPSPTMWGRIEGETPDEFGNNADYNFDKRSLDYDKASAIIDLIFSSNDLIIAIGNVVQANSSSTACAGFGVCITTPILSWIIGSGVQLLIAIAQEAAVIFYTVRASNNVTLYDNNKITFQGVTYASGAGDYAEYLIKKNIHEELYFGDVVGVVGGAVSKNTTNVDRSMVVSSKPIVLGAIPPTGTEGNYAKIAFMGQVPVKVFGKVNIGDYIIPSGNNDGFGIAVSPSKINVKDIKKIVGIAWESTENEYGLSKINVAVGLNSNDNNPIIERLENKVMDQDIKIDYLQDRMAEINKMLVKLLKGESITSEIETGMISNMAEQDTDNKEDKGYEIIESNGHDVVYFKVTDEHIEQSIKLAKEQMKENGTDIENDLFWQKMDNDSYFKKMIVEKFKSKLETGFHYHKSINENAKKH